MMNNLILRLEEIPLNGPDLISMCVKMGNNKVKWMLYDDLSKFQHVDQLFELNRATGAHTYNTILLLLRIHRDDKPATIGHWISLSFDDKLELQYFDPYALLPNQDLAETGERDLLTRLLGNIPLNVNRHRHQKIKENVNSCGRHTVIRSIFHFLSNNQYNDQVIQPPIRAHWIIDADAMVTLMTAFLDKSDIVVLKFFRTMADAKASSRPNSRLSKSAGGRFIPMTSLPTNHLGLGGSVI